MTASPHLPSEPWSRLGAFVSATLGLHFPPRRHQDLARSFANAAREFGFDDSLACIEWLLPRPPTPAMIQVLASHLTVGETYFFRDQPALDVLATEILPALIRARRGGGQRLRLWCAACCTGEEAYTLAILLHRLLPDLAQWQISIQATDVNARFLEKAVAGRYGHWSFRNAPAWLRPRYFERDAEGGYTVIPEIRRMVQFGMLNLVEGAEGFTRADLRGMDIVLCRNVLMYFTAPHMAGVMDKLWHCLGDDAWLVVSPGEASSMPPARFKAINYPGAILFQKKDATHKAAPPACAAPEMTVISRPFPPFDAPLVAENFADSHANTDLGADPEILALQARDCANQGRLAEALRWCDRWLGVDRLDAAGHYLRGVVLLEQDDCAAAQAALQRAIYLDGNFIMAHFTLGHLARRSGDQARARRHYVNAQRLLRRYGPSDILPESDALTAGHLAETLQALLSSAQSLPARPTLENAP